MTFFSILCHEIPKQYSDTLACIGRLHHPGFTISLNPKDGTEQEQVEQENGKIIRHCLTRYNKFQLYHEGVMTSGIPLITACAFDHPRIVQYFITQGLPPHDSLERRYVRDAAHAASDKKHFHILSQLLPDLSASELTEETRGKSLLSDVFEAPQPSLFWAMLEKPISSGYLHRKRANDHDLSFLESALNRDTHHTQYDIIATIILLHLNLDQHFHHYHENLLKSATFHKFNRPEAYAALTSLLSSTDSTFVRCRTSILRRVKQLLAQHGTHG